MATNVIEHTSSADCTAPYETQQGVRRVAPTRTPLPVSWTNGPVIAAESQIIPSTMEAESPENVNNGGTFIKKSLPGRSNSLRVPRRFSILNQSEASLRSISGRLGVNDEGDRISNHSISQAIDLTAFSDETELVRSGWLWRRGTIKLTWKRYWVEARSRNLSGGVLLFFQTPPRDEGALEAPTTASTVLSLSHCVGVSLKDVMTGGDSKWALKLRMRGSDVTLAADAPTSAESWVETIKSLIPTVVSPGMHKAIATAEAAECALTIARAEIAQLKNSLNLKAETLAALEQERDQIKAKAEMLEKEARRLRSALNDSQNARRAAERDTDIEGRMELMCSNLRSHFHKELAQMDSVVRSNLQGVTGVVESMESSVSRSCEAAVLRNQGEIIEKLEKFTKDVQNHLNKLETSSLSQFEDIPGIISSKLSQFTEGIQKMVTLQSESSQKDQSLQWEDKLKSLLESSRSSFEVSVQNLSDSFANAVDFTTNAKLSILMKELQKVLEENQRDIKSENQQSQDQLLRKIQSQFQSNTESLRSIDPNNWGNKIQQNVSAEIQTLGKSLEAQLNEAIQHINEAIVPSSQASFRGETTISPIDHTLLLSIESRLDRLVTLNEKGRRTDSTMDLRITEIVKKLDETKIGISALSRSNSGSYSLERIDRISENLEQVIQGISKNSVAPMPNAHRPISTVPAGQNIEDEARITSKIDELSSKWSSLEEEVGALHQRRSELISENNAWEKNIIDLKYSANEFHEFFASKDDLIKQAEVKEMSALRRAEEALNRVREAESQLLLIRGEISQLLKEVATLEAGTQKHAP
jgi:DNA repair exonuclease SbcCD ATPase subunit